MKTDEYRARLASTMSEDDLEEIVRELCQRFGVIRVHHRDSRGTTPGYPDDTLIGRRVLYRELKRQNGRVSPAQELMHEALRRAGADVDVWRPADHLSGRIAEEIRAIA